RGASAGTTTTSCGAAFPPAAESRRLVARARAAPRKRRSRLVVRTAAQFLQHWAVEAGRVAQWEEPESQFPRRRFESAPGHRVRGRRPLAARTVRRVAARLLPGCRAPLARLRLVAARPRVGRSRTLLPIRVLSCPIRYDWTA